MKTLPGANRGDASQFSHPKRRDFLYAGWLGGLGHPFEASKTGGYWLKFRW